jgi:hypothetical protein
MADFVKRVGYIDRIAAWFGIGDIDFRLSRTDRNRLMYASIFPAVILVGSLVSLLIDMSYSGNTFSFDRTIPWWSRVDAVIGTVTSPLLPLAVALLFLFSIYPASRALGAWSFVLVAVFLIATTCLAILGALPFVFKGGDAIYRDDWYRSHLADFANEFAYLAIGYAFLAFRGLSVRQLPRGRRVRIPPSQPREL